MNLYQNLRKEFMNTPDLPKSREYYRYLGYRNNLDAPITIMRAKGIESLFTRTDTHIFISDLIVGNTWGAYCNESETVLKHAKDFIDAIGERRFITNADHYAPNYYHTVKVGVTGLLDEIDSSLDKYCDDKEKCENLVAMKITLEAFRTMIDNYRKKAEILKFNPEYDENRLDFISKNCSALLEGPPNTFAQALQLIWLCHCAIELDDRGAMAIGRLDQYLYPFYKKDVEMGILTRESAVELLENTFSKIVDRSVINICIGGKDINENCVVNDVSYCIIEAVKNCNISGPNLSARICKNTPDEFLLECLKSIGTGLGYPALMNDEVNIHALLKKGYEIEDVYNYSMVGCIENFITGMQPPWSDSGLQVPKCFDFVFNNGISEFGGCVGLNLGDVEEIKTMSEFMSRFEIQIKHMADEHYRWIEGQNNSINQKHFADPFMSCFCHDCIGRGMNINDGGAKYPSVHGVGLHGVGTVSDSLAAIEKVVFVDKEATLSDLKNAINDNFEGYEDLRQKLIAAPKYGNNDEFADKYAVWFLDYISSVFADYKTRDGGTIYIAMATNIHNVLVGETTSATPDGRKRGEPFSDAASPTFGRDKNGPTSTLVSVSKLDYTKATCGTVLNQKYSPEMFKGENLQKLLALIKTYFSLGGQEIQINATSRETLIDALNNPDKYASLIVRVSGFSDYYTKLAPGVQHDILQRTQQD